MHKKDICTMREISKNQGVWNTFVCSVFRQKLSKIWTTVSTFQTLHKNMCLKTKLFVWILDNTLNPKCFKTKNSYGVYEIHASLGYNTWYVVLEKFQSNN